MTSVERSELLHALLSFAVVLMVWCGWNAFLALVVSLLGLMTGVLKFFPALYALYVSESVGYRIRHLIHPRREKAHSVVSVWESMEGVRVLPVPVLNDNYAYVVWCDATKEAAVVDPADPSAVWGAVQGLGLNLTTLITTHKHWDHAGGNLELVEKCPKLRVVGSAVDMPHCMTHAVREGDSLSLGRLTISFRDVPGHTKGHILTLVSTPDTPRLLAFTGDSLFCCGVGAFFEAYDPADLRKTHAVYHALPDSVVLFPGHEYSELLSYHALTRDPNNESLRRCHASYQQRRKMLHTTIPSTVGLEKEVNPFLRIPPETMATLPNSSAIQSAMMAMK